MKAPKEAIVLGASAGALEALSAVLPKLPSNFPLACMIVVHLPPDKPNMLSKLFQSKCQLNVEEVADKVSIQPGTIYFAPPDYHVLVEPDFRLSLSSEEAVNYSRPSIDVLFESAADAYGDRLLGIILTGANNDGAAGLKAVADAGGEAIVQQPDTAYASAMPLAALAACPTAHVLSPEGITNLLLNLPTAR